MGLIRLLARGYLLRRLLGGRHRGYGRSSWTSRGGHWGPLGGYGHRMGRRHGPGPFGYSRPRGGVQVRGCGCCLPVPLGVLGFLGLCLRALLRARSR